MGEVSTIGLDIAKSVFQVHGVDGAGAVVMRRRISRAKMLELFGRARLGQRTLKCVFLIGTRSAQSIRASGLTRRINRPDT